MSGSQTRHRLALVCALTAIALGVWTGRVGAYPSYDDGAGTGCVECHYTGSATGGFEGGLGLLHSKHLTTFGITSCGACHPAGGGSLPVRTYVSSGGYGCAGCHGEDYGQTSVLSGLPKATGYGLRAAHALNGVTACAGCHFAGSTETGDPDPLPAILPETEMPPYYGTALTNLLDPCSTAQESFDGTIGLDNDGNGVADADDPACADRVTTPTPRPATPTPTPTAVPTPFNGKRLTKVYPGQSIQAAVDGAAPGGKIYVMPGTYEEISDNTNAVTVSKDGIKLIAKSTKLAKVILQAHPGQRNGIVAEPAPGAPRIQKFLVKGFTVQGFPNNGIVVRSVDGFSILKNESIDNKENGIWPILSAEGLVSRNVSYGSDDSAMWVEDSVNVRVVRNVTHGSVTGLELSNSDDILVKRNESYDNSVGIGLYMQPGRNRKESNRWTVVKNYVHDNNRVNTAPPGSMAGDLPLGGGILLLGPDNSEIASNQVDNNDFYGIAVLDYCTAMAFGSYNCTDNPPDFDPYPDNNRIVLNTLVHNGTNPPDHPAAILASDMVMYGGGTGNCWFGNTYVTSFPTHAWDFPSCDGP